MVAVNGRIITGMDDLHQILSGLPISTLLHITTIREGRLIEVPLEPRIR
jgi:hypothetical protein